MYAIIATGGKQYKVAEGDIIKVEKLGVEAGETYTFDQVLAVSDGELKVGAPTVAGATVEASVVENGKARKVIVYKYKRKSGYHKKNGHRQQYTAVKIEKDQRLIRRFFMTHVTIYRNKENECIGFTVIGHAEYADAGEDIICAGISMLVINTCNAIEMLTTAKFFTDDQ